MPPSVIIKKLKQAGWIVGAKPRDDLCPECQRKPLLTHVDQAKKALKQIAAPMVSNGIHFSEVEALALKLPHEQAKQLIKTLREALPVVPKPKKEKVLAAPAESDSEYQAWLDAKDRAHKETT
jgi:hypothetical protein